MSATATDKVQSIRRRVEDRIGTSRFRTWFADVAEFRLSEQQLDVLVSNHFVGNWIASNYYEDLLTSARDVLGPNEQFSIRILPVAESQEGATAMQRPDHPNHDRPLRRSAQRSAEQVAPQQPRAPRPRLRGQLHEFVLGPSNQLAHSAALQVATRPGEAFKLLVLHGGCGLGKTHLLQGICNQISTEHPTLEWCYISGEEFTNEYIHAVKAGPVDLFRAKYRSVDVLVIDDIHFLANKSATQSEFLHTFDAIDACGKAVVLSSDRHPRSIATLSEPLINRLVAGMVVEIAPPCFPTRCAILKQRATRMNAKLSDDVIEFVAQHVTRNVRELEGALYKLVALASLTKGPITRELAENALAQHIAAQSQPPSVAQIVELVAQRFSVSVEQINGRGRDRTISLARGLAMYLVRKNTALSFPEIGRAMGGKNHSTVLMAYQRVEQQLAKGETVTWRVGTDAHKAPIRDLHQQLADALSLR